MTSSCKRKAGEAGWRLAFAKNTAARADRAIPRYRRFRRAARASLRWPRPDKLCASVLRRRRVRRHPTASCSPGEPFTSASHVQTDAACQHSPVITSPPPAAIRIPLRPKASEHLRVHSWLSEQGLEAPAGASKSQRSVSQASGICF